MFCRCLHGNLLLLSTVLLNRDTGGRHWGVLGDVGPLHGCVCRHIRACAAQGHVAELLGEGAHHGCRLDGHGMVHGWGEDCACWLHEV